MHQVADFSWESRVCRVSEGLGIRAGWVPWGSGASPTWAAPSPEATDTCHFSFNTLDLQGLQMNLLKVNK